MLIMGNYKANDITKMAKSSGRSFMKVGQSEQGSFRSGSISTNGEFFVESRDELVEIE